MEKICLYAVIIVAQCFLIFALTTIAFYNVALWGYYAKDAGRKPKIIGCLIWILCTVMIIGLGFIKYPLLNTNVFKDPTFYISLVGGISGNLCLCVVFGLALRKNNKTTKISRDKELEHLKYRKLNKQLFKQYQADNDKNSKIILRAVKKNRWKITRNCVSYPPYLSEFEYLVNGKVYVMLPRDQFYEMPWLLSRNYYRINDKFIFEYIDAFSLDTSAARDKWIKKYQENNDLIDKINEQLAECRNVSSWRTGNEDTSKK